MANDALFRYRLRVFATAAELGDVRPRLFGCPSPAGRSSSGSCLTCWPSPGQDAERISADLRRTSGAVSRCRPTASDLCLAPRALDKKDSLGPELGYAVPGPLSRDAAGFFEPLRPAPLSAREGKSHRTSQSLAKTTPPRPESNSQSMLISRRPPEIQLDTTAGSSPGCRRVAFRCPRCLGQMSQVIGSASIASTPPR